MHKAEIADFFLIQKTNLPIQSINIKLKDRISVYSQKEHLKKFGKCVLTYIKMVFEFQRHLNGKRNLKMQMNFLEKQVKEF
jgi:hypothetical protein